MRVFRSIDELTAAVGEEIGPTGWMTITQERVDTFADATGDHQVLDYVWLALEPTDFWPSKGTPLTFGELHPVMASEILSDLTALAEKAEK